MAELDKQLRLTGIEAMLKKMQAKSGSETSQSANPNVLIEINRVFKTFHNAAGEFTVLKGIDVAFPRGEFASIVGRSGSGKSTLLNMITGIDHPTSGSVRVGNTILHTMNEGKLSVWRGRNMGIVFQFFQLLPMLTLLENVMLPMDFCDTFIPVERESRAKALLALVGLQGVEHKYPAAVSGGQQQSAAVARALANDPPILVADEPTGNLDSNTAERVLEIFEEQAEKGKTILMVTHDRTLARRARRILVISDGELIPEGITNVFPAFSHESLLQVSRAAKIRTFDSGEVLLRAENVPAVLIITCGSVAVVCSGPRGTQVVADRLQTGALFSYEDSKTLKRPLIGLCAESAGEALIIDRLPDSPELRAELVSHAHGRELIYSKNQQQRGERSLFNG